MLFAIAALAGGIIATTMGLMSLYGIIALGTRVHQRSTGTDWSFAESVALGAGILIGGLRLIAFGWWWLRTNQPK